MRKKDYELIGGVFKSEMDNLERLMRFRVSRTGKLSPYNEGQVQELLTLIRNMAFTLGQSDPKFNRLKFLEQCGLPTPQRDKSTRLEFTER